MKILSSHLGKSKTYLSLFLSLLLAGCATNLGKRSEKVDAYEKVRRIVSQESKFIDDYRDGRDDNLHRKDDPKIDLTPVIPKFNPLDQIVIKSLSIDDGDIALLLKAMAAETGMNLLLHPDVSSSKEKITVNFSNIRASLVFDEIMNIADMNGSVQGNLIRVDPYKEKIFTLDFIETNIEANFDMGGDVLGSSVGSSGSENGGLTGQFNIKGKGGENSNPYDSLMKIVDKMKSPQGSYALNRVGGSIYIKDKPSIVKNISLMMDNLKDMMSRQILIEARILEIQLDDGYEYGIDWGLVKNNAIAALNGSVSVSSGAELSLDNGFSVANNPEQAGLGIVFRDGDWLGAVNMLNNFGETKVISNPHIRARHGQPSMISVGRSNTFISKTETSIDTDADTQTATIETDQVFDGLLLGVIPFIADKTISLSIHPIKSDVDDESLNLISVQNSSVSLPRVDLKEMSTTIKLRDGDTVILGGLIDRRKENVKSGVPGLSSIPFLGWLFKKERYQEVTREFVIVMKVTLV